jgi:Rieske Fe-S protein
MSNLKLSAFIFGIVFFFSCSKNNSQLAQNNPVYIAAANTPINQQIYITAHPNLQVVGGIDTIPNVGVKGLIVYHASDGFYVYDRACTNDGTTKSNAAKCPACNSQYSISDGGNVLKSPATIPLKRYTASYDGTTEIISVTN